MKAYLSYSLDEELRTRASSGGCCKEIIRYCLQQNIIDYAVITILDDENPLQPKTIITKDIDIIVSSKSNSIYDNTDPLSVLSELRMDKRYIFVGLPCHIEYFKKYCSEKSIYNIAISLFCNCIPKNFHDIILEHMSIDKEDVLSFEYRGHGWPGYISIILKSGEHKQTLYRPLWSKWASQYRTMEDKCNICTKFISYAADICVGDAWRSDIIKTDNKGTCYLVAQTNEAQYIIQGCCDAKQIHLSDVENNYIYEIDNRYKNIKGKRKNNYNI